ncbi:prolyl oligopeptidase family serine peptidase [Oleiagrimonas sp. C23AA]|uniref:S9 family peptidase n=1 Tax=Oleiagrimonas sp. C23AA TaxID=2719047 RepID=UPI00141EC124|nr:prolyl oligopeptidase family serine peptidase [Oleiagrimonas sp. C23AA]NII11061.1 S9 family peptidase [Oleiagrimonas sp. C23AA]
MKMPWIFTLAPILMLALLGSPARAGTNTDTVLQIAKKSAQAATKAPDIPRGTFFRRPPVRDISMAPNGQWLAFRRHTKRGWALWIRHIASGKEHRIMSDSAGTMAYWSGDSARLWLVDSRGLGVYDVATQSGQRIFRFDRQRRQSFWLVDPNAPDDAVLREKVPVNGQWVFRYLAIDAHGKTRVIATSHKALTAILLGPDATPRYLAGFAGGEFDTVIWRVEHGHKQAIMRCPQPQQCVPVAYRRDKVWALAHHGRDLASLQVYSKETKKWKVLDHDPRGIADAVAVIMQPNGKDWFANAYRPDRIEWHGRTAKAKAQLAQLQAKLPRASLDIDMSSNGQRWLVQAARADWMYDRDYLFEPASGSLTPLFAKARKPPVPAAQLASMIPLHWRGNGGVLLHGYVYLPKGIHLSTAPIIASIHGGPYNRSNGTMNPIVQLLVNRGYIVFQPNFRASTGYGIAYATGSRGHFGEHGGALDDIISGLDYLLVHGIGDPKKQAIVGHSFGGYASLLAVTFHPHRFAFAFAGAAPVDFAWDMQHIAAEGGSGLPADGPTMKVLLSHFGVPWMDPAWHKKMHRQSPLAHAADLLTPVYLWAGARDDRVPVSSLVRYVAATPFAHRPALLVDPQSGHNPQPGLHRQAEIWLLEAAADHAFGGGVTPPSPELDAFIDKNLHRSPAAPLP